MSTKGDAIVAYIKKHPDASRKEVAAKVGCTVARVGEIIRAGLTGGPVVPRVARGEKTAAPAPKTRTGRCEHEKRGKKKAGTCTKGCPPLAA